jgi:hypothetical protein
MVKLQMVAVSQMTHNSRGSGLPRAAELLRAALESAARRIRERAEERGRSSEAAGATPSILRSRGIGRVEERGEGGVGDEDIDRNGSG